MSIVLSFVLIAMALSAFGWGFGLSTILKLRFQDRLEQVCTSTFLGTAVLASIVPLLGALGGLRRWPLAAILVAGVGLVFALSGRLIPRAPRTLMAPSEKAIVLALFVCAAGAFVGALAPIGFIDALTYHVFEAREYVRAGHLIDLPNIWQSYQPISVEMLYAWGIALVDDRMAPLVDWGLGALTLAATYLLARRRTNRLGGLIAAATFYCTAMTAWESTSCFVELGVALGLTASLFALLKWNDTDETAWLSVAGVMAGFAASCKLTAVQVPVFLGIVIVYLSARHTRGVQRTARALAIFGGLALAIVGPWYLRSFLLTGNPVYPFLPSVFGPNSTNGDVKQILDSYGSGKSPLNLLLSPWYLISQGGRTENGQFLNPLPFLLAPVILWRCRRSWEFRSVLAVCLLWFVVWLKTAQIARYLLPIQPLAAVLVADAVTFLLLEGGVRRSIGTIAAVLFIGFSALGGVLYDSQFFPVVFGRESRDAYLARTSWYYPLYQQLNAELPKGSRVLTDDAPTYYLDVPHTRLRNAEFAKGAAYVRDLIVKGHYTHVVVHNNPAVDAVMGALFPVAKRDWRRSYDLLVSRTFGGAVNVTATLYSVSLD